MPKLILAGRTDIDEYFERSGVTDDENFAGTPFLVFAVEGETVSVQVIDTPALLATYPDDTRVMSRWVTDEINDYFQFTVGLFKQYRDARLRRLQSAKRVVKVIGPRGGFRSLSYEYADAAGVTIHVATGIRDEAERLEAFFEKNSIPMTIQAMH
jgi:hypothetical protein